MKRYEDDPLRSSPIPLVWYCQFDVSPVNYSDSDSEVIMDVD